MSIHIHIPPSTRMLYLQRSMVVGLPLSLANRSNRDAGRRRCICDREISRRRRVPGMPNCERQGS